MARKDHQDGNDEKDQKKPENTKGEAKTDTVKAVETREVKKVKKGGQFSKKGTNLETVQFDTLGISSSVLESHTIQLTTVNASAPRSVSTPVEETTGDRTPEEANAGDTDLREIANMLENGDETLQLKGIQQLLAKLKQDNRTPTDAIIQFEVVPSCVNFLKNEHTEKKEIQLGALEVLTRMTSDNEKLTQVVVDKGAVEHLIRLMNSDNIGCAAEAVSAIGNIAEYGSIFQPLLISQDILPPLLAFVESSKPVIGKIRDFFLKKIAWALQKLSLSYKPESAEQVAALWLPALAELLKTSHMKTLFFALWSLGVLSCKSKEFIHEFIDQVVVKSGLVPRLVQLLDCGDNQVITACLYNVGNFVGGSDSHTTQLFLDSNLLPRLTFLLQSTNADIVHDAARVVRNIAAKSNSQALKNFGIVPLLVDVLNQGNLDTQKQVIYTLYCIVLKHPDQVRHLFEARAIKAMCGMLQCNNPYALSKTLDAIAATLRSATHSDIIQNVVLAFEEYGGLHLIGDLQYHENLTINRKASFIIDTFF